MIYVGIDIAKLNHFASIISSDGEVLVEPFKFSNDSGGFRLLLSKLDQFESDSLVIGLESTAHYGNNLVEFLVSRHFHVSYSYQNVMYHNFQQKERHILYFMSFSFYCFIIAYFINF